METAPHFVSLVASGHLTLDMRAPAGGSFHAWKKREPWFPDGESTDWRDVYCTWFGAGELPVVNLHLMGSALPEWDEKIRRCYGALWKTAAEGGLQEWEDEPRSLVAKLILVDQFPRHLFRGKREAFSTDELSRRLAERLAGMIAA